MQQVASYRIRTGAKVMLFGGRLRRSPNEEPIHIPAGRWRRHVPSLLQWVRQMVMQGLATGLVLVTLGCPTRSQIMNKKFHAMIGDIHQQGFRGYSFEGMKAVLVNQFALDLARGERKSARRPRSRPSADKPGNCASG